MSFLLSIAASSFFLPQFLSYLLDNDTKNSLVLSYAKSLQLSAYYHHQRRNHAVGSFIWIRNTTSLVDDEAQYSIELADFYLKDDQLDKAIFWYQQAVKKGLDEIRVTLAQLYFNQQNYHQAKEILLAKIEFNDKYDIEKSLALLLEIALIEGDLAKASTHASALYKINKYHDLFDELTKYKVFSQFPTNESTSDINRFPNNMNIDDLVKNCIASIQFFATNLADLRYTSELIEQVKLRPMSGYSCFRSVRYIPLKTLECWHEKDETISCNEAIWQAYQKDIETRYIGVMVPHGGAKVHNGIMYLDSHDTVDVFAHELAHLHGFIDEYSLPVNHSRCSQVQAQAFAHNVAVLAKIHSGEPTDIRNKILAQVPWRSFIKDDTPILTKQGNHWLIGTPDIYKSEVGLFPSDTCQKFTSTQAINLQSYKPLAKRTSLNYFELDFPLLYQRLLEKNTKLFLMPSFHRNIEKALNH